MSDLVPNKCMRCGYYVNTVLYDENNVAYTKMLNIIYDSDGQRVMNPNTYVCNECMEIIGSNKFTPLNDGYALI